MNRVANYSDMLTLQRVGDYKKKLSAYSYELGTSVNFTMLSN